MNLFDKIKQGIVIGTAALSLGAVSASDVQARDPNYAGKVTLQNCEPGKTYTDVTKEGKTVNFVCPNKGKKAKREPDCTSKYRKQGLAALCLNPPEVISLEEKGYGLKRTEGRCSRRNTVCALVDKFPHDDGKKSSRITRTSSKQLSYDDVEKVLKELLQVLRQEHGTLESSLITINNNQLIIYTQLEELEKEFENSLRKPRLRDGLALYANAGGFGGLNPKDLALLWGLRYEVNLGVVSPVFGVEYAHLFGAPFSVRGRKSSAKNEMEACGASGCVYKRTEDEETKVLYEAPDRVSLTAGIDTKLVDKKNIKLLLGAALGVQIYQANERTNKVRDTSLVNVPQGEDPSLAEPFTEVKRIEDSQNGQQIERGSKITAAPFGDLRLELLFSLGRDFYLGPNLGIRIQEDKEEIVPLFNGGLSCRYQP